MKIETAKNIEKDLVDLLVNYQWLQKTENISELKDKADSILEGYLKQGLIYNFINKFNENNIADSNYTLLETFVQETKDSNMLVNHITVKRK